MCSLPCWELLYIKRRERLLPVLPSREGRAEHRTILLLLMLRWLLPAELGSNLLRLVLCRYLPAEHGAILVLLMPLRTNVKGGCNNLHNTLSVGFLLQRK